MIRSNSLVTLAFLAAPLFVSCDSPPRNTGQTSLAKDSTVALDPQQAVEEVVAQFGSRMQRVSLLAPDSIASAQLQEAYGTLVTPEVLAEWMSQPASAPGRRVSSPWPDHIEVQSIVPSGTDEFDVTGEVVYLTSVEQDSGGRAASEPARLHVRRSGDGSWRISAYTQGPAASGT